MSVDTSAEIVINRGRAAVACYMFDPHNDAAWTTGVVESRPRESGPLKAGSRVERVSTFLGRRFGYEYEVVARDDDRKVDIKVDNPFPMQIQYALADAAGGQTVARIHVSGNPGRFFLFAGSLLGWMARRNLKKDLAALKGRLEASG